MRQYQLKAMSNQFYWSLLAVTVQVNLLFHEFLLTTIFLHLIMIYIIWSITVL